jgi:curli production assembly/transport component CsgG
VGELNRMHYARNIGAMGVLLAALASAGLSGCGTIAREQLDEGRLPPVLNPITCVNQTLRDLPPPTGRVVVAVYGYTDQTGQMKPADNVQTLSKAVPRAATSVLIKALQDTGNGSWFTVVERERLDNLLKERRIVQEMRKTYLGEETINPRALPALLFAGILLEGGIIGHDSNLQTGGIGARLLGIGGDVKYRLDTVTIYLRAVSTKTGQVLASVTTHKSIASYGIQGSIFRYVAVDRILEAEAGYTKNEPDQLAVQQAIEKAVYALVMEGAEQKLWSFNDKPLQKQLIWQHRAEQFASVSAAQTYAQTAKANAALLAANEEKAQAIALAQQKKEQAEAEKAAAAAAKAAAESATGATPRTGAKTGDASPQGAVRPKDTPNNN